MSIQGEIHNEWVSQCKPDKWCDVVIHDNANGGDKDMIKLMFNSMGGPRQVQIRHLECGVYDREYDWSRWPAFNWDWTFEIETDEIPVQTPTIY